MAGPADHLKEHTFKPGQSGNPGGRPGGKTAARELARYGRELTNGGCDAIDGILAIARDGRVKPETRLRAWELYLDRCHGKSLSAKDLGGDGLPGASPKLRELTDEQLRALAILDAGLDGDRHTEH